MAPELRPLCSLDAVLSEPIVVGEGPSGLRIIYEVLEANIAGERLRGVMSGRAAADWVSVAGGIATLDVRATFETHDGAHIYVQYRGRVRDGTIYVAPLFETGDERYAWVNSLLAVGIGRVDGTKLHYDWYEVV
jgi:hypothetical protein